MQIPAFVINLDSRPDRWAAAPAALITRGRCRGRGGGADSDLVAGLLAKRIAAVDATVTDRRPLQFVPTMIRQRHEEFSSDIQSTEPWSCRSGVEIPLGGSKARRWGGGGELFANWPRQRLGLGRQATCTGGIL